MTESKQEQQTSKRDVVGLVVSDKMTKTIVVEVSRRIRHPHYQKVITRYKKFHAHDEKEEAGMGDVVRIEESRPLSRTKRWRLAEIVQRAGQAAGGAS
jgi:small subunit ribosomal protein S17